MKEITEKDLNTPLLKKRTKVELMRMLCHVANMANSYTPAGTGAIGDRALMKLNLTRPRFEVRFKEAPAAGDDTERTKPRVYVPPPYESVVIPWEPVPGEEVIIKEGSTYWAGGKKGTVIKKMEGGWEVKVHFADGFNGETTARDHVICAYKVSQVLPESQSPINETPANPPPNPS